MGGYICNHSLFLGVIMKNHEKLNSIREELNLKFLERKQEIECILTSLVANTNAQFIGSPGTGKSALAQAVSELLDCSFFKVNLDQDLDPDFVIGHISLKEMRDNDRILRNTSGKISDGQLVFLDECNKVNSAMKNALLLPLNERMVDIGDGKPRPTEIRTILGASNEYPGCTSIDDDVSHLIHDPNWDRWILRMQVEFIKSDRNFVKLLSQRDTIGRVDVSKKIPLQVLDDMREDSKSVDLQKVIPILSKIRSEMMVEDIRLSDRRWLGLCKVISARAVMRGSQVAEQEDLEIMKHGLWLVPDQSETTTGLLYDNLKSEYHDAIKVKSVIEQQLSDLDNAISKWDSNAIPMLTTTKDNLISFVKNAKADEWTDSRAIKVRNECQDLIQGLNIAMMKCLGL
jgi:MoxR-like ATPase